MHSATLGISVSISQATFNGASTTNSLTSCTELDPSSRPVRLCHLDHRLTIGYSIQPRVWRSTGMLSKGVGLFPTEPVAQMRGYVHLCEALGYDNVWLGDSQN